MKKFILLAALAGLPAAIMAQTNPDGNVKIKKVPIASTRANSGVTMFRAYCAACHGVDGAGDGPAVPALKTTPTDLTQLKATHNGSFPGMKVEAVLRGEDVIAAHGSSDMPLWGPLFHSMDSGDKSVSALRIHNLTEYLKSIQK